MSLYVLCTWRGWVCDQWGDRGLSGLAQAQPVWGLKPSRRLDPWQLIPSLPLLTLLRF